MSVNYNQIIVNGEVFNCMYNMSLMNLLMYLDFDLKSIAVEYNSEIVSYDNMSSIILQPNDCIEVITIVGGG
uniref:Thiamine biosynthesis protein S n=1 Tax=Asparagopsis taxiformis TaxID=260499 RepID=A0A1C9CCB6_9FLOR|nr:thiamine biosynthesis protein S [Asparagopsis taxiformis]AOM66030.1 thiamine biosynthesis protein S [Asparagopsis taxiformis]